MLSCFSMVICKVQTKPNPIYPIYRLFVAEYKKQTNMTNGLKCEHEDSTLDFTTLPKSSSSYIFTTTGLNTDAVHSYTLPGRFGTQNKQKRSRPLWCNATPASSCCAPRGWRGVSRACVKTCVCNLWATPKHSRGGLFFPLLMVIKQKSIYARPERLTAIPGLHRDKLSGPASKSLHILQHLFTLLSESLLLFSQRTYFIIADALCLTVKDT